MVGRRPREAGGNARLGAHGREVRVPLLRLSTEDGASGFGPARLDAGQAGAALGADLDALITAERSVADGAAALEFPLWDLLGQRTGVPVYQLLAQRAGRPWQQGPCAYPATIQRS